MGNLVTRARRTRYGRIRGVGSHLRAHRSNREQICVLSLVSICIGAFSARRAAIRRPVDGSIKNFAYEESDGCSSVSRLNSTRPRKVSLKYLPYISESHLICLPVFSLLPLQRPHATRPFCFFILRGNVISGHRRAPAGKLCACSRLEFDTVTCPPPPFLISESSIRFARTLFACAPPIILLFIYIYI